MAALFTSKAESSEPFKGSRKTNYVRKGSSSSQSPFKVLLSLLTTSLTRNPVGRETTQRAESKCVTPSQGVKIPRKLSCVWFSPPPPDLLSGYSFSLPVCEGCTLK